jgi:hypothetical protein
LLVEYGVSVLLARVIAVVCGVLVTSSAAFAAMPIRVTWGNGVSARVMLKPGETRMFLHGKLQTGDSVGCVNGYGYGATTVIPNYMLYTAGLPPALAAIVGYTHASKPGKGSVTIRVKRPSSTTVVVTCS